MKRLLIFWIIGRIALEVWSALLPQEQALRVAVMANAFVEQQSCSKITMDIDEGDEDVTVSAECSEVML